MQLIQRIKLYMMLILFGLMNVNKVSKTLESPKTGEGI